MGAQGPNPQPIFDTLVAYQRSAVLKAAIDLDLFSAIRTGAADPPALAARLGASERGVRSLCDYLAATGFLAKRGGTYDLTEDSARFLDRRSPHYMGSVARFLVSPHLRRAFERVAEAVRRGSTAIEGDGLMGPEHPAWVEFARGMSVAAAPQAALAADLLARDGADPSSVLDVAAGHGLYGIEAARRWPGARVTFQDWPNVLEVAEENAREAGIEGRFDALPGDARSIDLGGPYDVVLLTNFLHHFDAGTCTAFLRKVRAAMAPGGRLATIESLVNEDRVTPPHAATFSLVMLVVTAGGDVLTRSGIEGILTAAGFRRHEVHPLGESPQSIVLSVP